MTNSVFTWILALTLAAVMSIPNLAQAAVTKWECGCLPEKKSRAQCSCDGYTFQLKPYGTREFRGLCIAAMSELGVELNVTRKDSNITCTAPGYFFGSTIRMCTNWSMLFKRTVGMSVV